MPYANFSDADLASYFGVSPEQGAIIGRLASGQTQPNDAAQILQWQNQQIGPAGNPSGSATKWGDIEYGLGHLGAHPQGSKYHGGLGSSLGQLGLNFATGGLYGAGKSLANVASGEQDVVSGAREGLSQLGPWGSTSYSISPQLAERGNFIGAGAGAGAALFGGGAAGTMYGPEGIPILTDPSTGYAAMNVGVDASGLAIPGAGIGAGAIPGAIAGGGSALGAAGGAYGAQQLASILTPNQGASQLVGSAAGASAQGLSPQQQQMLGGGSSEPHKGLAYKFEQRQRGGKEDPGIAALYNISEKGY